MGWITSSEYRSSKCWQMTVSQMQSRDWFVTIDLKEHNFIYTFCHNTRSSWCLLTGWSLTVSGSFICPSLITPHINKRYDSSIVNTWPRKKVMPSDSTFSKVGVRHTVQAQFTAKLFQCWISCKKNCPEVHVLHLQSLCGHHFSLSCCDWRDLCR